jgi:hypothetical protein
METPEPKTKRNKTRKRHATTHNRTFKKRDYESNDGMLTTVWGPGMWHFLHTMSFNYPTHPTHDQKVQYRNFIISLQQVLPCKYCRQNLHKNFKTFPLRMCHMASRDTFSRYVYRLHEIVNKLLGKSNKLTYCDVRERYEHFRSRCTVDDDTNKIFNFDVFKTNTKTKTGTSKKAKELGCTEPLYGEKSKCVMKIIPQKQNEPTFTIDTQCVKKRLDVRA